VRDPKRINRILERIREIWVENPDLRLTQLIMNALNMNQDPYYVEDEHLENCLNEYQKEYKE
jgi:uncharacterized protein YihD (DUF1040 family)